MTPTLTAAPPVLTIRQTNLTWILSKCPKGADALIRGIEGPHYGGANRGQAVHEFFARYNICLSASNRQTDWSLTAGLLAGVFGEHPELSIQEREDVTDQAKLITDTYVLDREHYYGSEEHLEYDLELHDGRVVRITGTLDLLLVFPEEGGAVIRDAKSNHQLPADSAVRQDLQLTIYALLVLRNLPNIDWVRGELWFTRYGKLLPRKDEAIWTFGDLDAFEAHLCDVLSAFLDATYHEAIPGSHCQYCPLRRPGKCTLWQSYYGIAPPPPLTSEQAVKLGRRIIAIEQRAKEYKAALKPYVNEHGPVAVGSGEYAEVWDFRHSESEEIPAGAFLDILKQNRDLIGEQPLDDLLSVKKTKAFKNLRYRKDLKDQFDDVARMVTGSSEFRAKKPEGMEDE